MSKESIVRKTRAEMIVETKFKLISAARQAFARSGYAATSMDDFTSTVGLTRGALHHHFGDKKGLFAAVVQQLDEEVDQQLQIVYERNSDLWQGFCECCQTYLKMSLDPEIQQILFKDARAVLGEQFIATQSHCIASMAEPLQLLMQTGQVKAADAEALACLVNGSLIEAAFWIANAPDTEARLSRALSALDLLLAGIKAS